MMRLARWAPILILIFYSCMGSAEELKNIDSKPVSIQDPFARGISRSPSYSKNNDRATLERHRFDDFASLDDIRYYRVSSLIEHLDADNTLLEIKEKEIVETKESFRGFYIPLGVFVNQSNGLQAGRDFITRQSSNLNKRVVLRAATQKNKTSYFLEYGPFKHEDLATASCFFLKTKVSQLKLECNNLRKRMVSSSELIDRTNSATLALSQAGFAYYSQIPVSQSESKDSGLSFNPEDLKAVSMEIKEDEPLGVDDFYIVRINRLGVHLANKFNEITLIPSVTFPINNRTPASNPAGQTPPLKNLIQGPG